MSNKQKTVITISMLSEITQAISHFNADQALLFLTEKAVEITESTGALLMTLHEKNSKMVSFIKSFKDSIPEIDFSKSFYSDCFDLFIRLRDNGHNTSTHNFYDISEKCPLNEILIWPVMLSSRPIGLLAMIKPSESNDYSTEQQNFLEIITPIMASLFENLRQNDEMIHKNSRLSALYEISQQAESLIDFRDIYDALGKVARSFIKFDTYRLYFLTSDGKNLEARVDDKNISESFPRTIPVGEGSIGLAAKELKPHLTYTKEFNSVLILPIEVSGRLIGVLAIGSKRPYAYRDEDIIGLRIIATQIASIDHIFKDLISLKGFTERIIESMTSGVLIFDRDGKATHANPEIKAIFGQQIPENWSPFDESSEKLPEQLQNLIIEALSSNITLENKKIKIRHSSKVIIVEVNAFPFRNESGGMLGTAFFIKDVTQIKALEDQLKQADKLSALGVLAAGIAHEIRNPLTGMKMIVQLLQSEFGDKDPRSEPLHIIQSEIDRLEGIVGSLLDFARPSRPKIVDIELEKLIRECCVLIKNQFKKQNIKFSLKTTTDCPNIVGDPDQLKQVFINILNNAVQAMENGGNLTVSIEPRDDSVAVIFEDSGEGIPAERIEEIFNPFMTTKEDGTGLGLSMALRIIEEHGGRIEVQSTEGIGSTFLVYLHKRQK